MGLVELLVLLAAVGGSAWVCGTMVWLWHRTKQLEDRILGQAGSAPHLMAELHELRSQLQASNQDLDELRQRLDFLERLLGGGEGGRSGTLGPPPQTPGGE